MKLAAITVVVLAAAAFTISPARAGGDGNVNFFLGQKSLDSDDWEPVEDQIEFGAVMSFGGDDWPVHIAVDVLVAADEETVPSGPGTSVTVTGSTFELAAGVRKVWGKGRFRPYLGAGIAVIGAAFEGDDGFITVDASDSTIGYWAGGGMFWRLGKHFNIGFDARYSSAEVDLDFGSGFVAQDVSAGGLHYGVLVGFGW